MAIRIRQRGDFNNIDRFLAKMKRGGMNRKLNECGRLGVQALSANTPVRTGKTASLWDYDIRITSESAAIHWTNANVNSGVNIAVIIQYGHGTGTGGYVQGIDYINPAMRPVFDKIADIIWKEVTSA